MYFDWKLSFVSKSEQSNNRFLFYCRSDSIDLFFYSFLNQAKSKIEIKKPHEKSHGSKNFFLIFYNVFNTSFIFLTASPLLCKSCLFLFVQSISTILSQPFFPITTGTPMQISFCPNSPSSYTQHVNNFFSSRTMVSTNAAPAAPGAYQAEVPINFVNVAPPTIVSATICFCCSAFRIL